MGLKQTLNQQDMIESILLIASESHSNSNKPLFSLNVIERFCCQSCILYCNNSTFFFKNPQNTSTNA